MTDMNHINFLEELFYQTASLCLWQFSPAMELERTNCSTKLFHNVFLLSSCHKYLTEYFKENNAPVYLFDDLCFLWAAVPEFAGSRLTAVCVLGPVLSTNTSGQFVKQKMDIQHMSIHSQKTLLDILNRIPLLPTPFLGRYVCMLYYALNGAVIRESGIRLQREPEALPVQTPAIVSPHDTYYNEALLLKSIEDGIPDTDFLSHVSTAQIGVMAPGDPIRQAKDEAIGYATLFTRAAVRGGAPVEAAYNLSDQFIQLAEAAGTILDIRQLIESMYLRFTELVSDIKLQAVEDSVIRDCMAYIENHITEEISLDELARELGYAKYYLTTRFKKEYGRTLNEYIQFRRIEYAKALLKNPYKSILEISELLKFATPSYFSSVFRRQTGMTPTEYRKKQVPKNPVFLRLQK